MQDPTVRTPSVETLFEEKGANKQSQSRWRFDVQKLTVHRQVFRNYRVSIYLP